jgi:exonuclease SbcD
MRFVHTSDWHLGRLFHAVHLTEDQAHVLDQFVALITEAKPDAVLVSGDVYDRAVPPPEAVALLDEVLSRIVVGLKVPMVVIAGNHDSPQRLGFGSQLLAQPGLYMRGTISAQVAPIIVSDDAGPVHIYALPYAEPAVVRQQLVCDTIQDHEAAMRALVEAVWQMHPSGQRAILMAHAFVAGGHESESERPLAVGGAGTVSADCFAGFHYVALGHLHGPQSVGSPIINYSGSLLKYSFSEVNQAKSVGLVEMDAHGHCSVERISLTPRRDTRCIEGYLADILKGPKTGESREDYVLVRLLDTGAILDAMGQIRKVYPNALHIERPGLTAGGEMHGPRLDHRQMDEAELFAQFFSQVTGEPLTEEQRSSFASVVDAMRRSEREAVG